MELQAFQIVREYFLILGLALADDRRTLLTSYLDIYGQNL